MKRLSKLVTSLAWVLPLAGCATSVNQPIVDGGPALAPGSMAGLGQPVALHDIVLTPMTVREDSRCPMNARCVWAGRIEVEVRIDGAGWRETLPFTPGNVQQVRGYLVNLIRVEPDRTTESEIEPQSYRFGFEGWPPGRPPD